MQNSQITYNVNKAYDNYIQDQSNKEVAANKEQQTIIQKEKKDDALSVQLIKKVESTSSSEQQKLVFSINEKTNQIIAKIVDVSTDEVIREIPSEKIVEMIADMCEKAGIFIDKKL